MRAFISKLARSLVSHAVEITGAAGMGLIAYGVSLVYFPAGFIVGGVLLILAAIDAGRS